MISIEDIPEIKQAYEARMNAIRTILQLHTQKKSSQDIGRAVRVAESYVIEVLKKGEDRMSKELAELYGVRPIVKPVSTDILCNRCKVPYNEHDTQNVSGFVLRLIKCPKCKTVIYHPVDIQEYARNVRIDR